MTKILTVKHNIQPSNANTCVYLATVIDQYADPGYNTIRSFVLDTFRPKCLIEPARENWTVFDWYYAWGRILPDLSALVIWPRKDGTIGHGVFMEYADACLNNIPVYVVWPEVGLLTCFSLTKVPKGGMRNYARIIPEVNKK